MRAILLSVLTLGLLVGTSVSAEPHETQTQHGYIQCQGGAIVVTANCVPVQNVLGDLGIELPTRQVHQWDPATDPAGTITFTVEWTPTTPLGNELQLVVYDPANGTTLAHAAGVSPLAVSLDGAMNTGIDVLETRVFPRFDGGLVVDQRFTVTMSATGA